MSVEVINEQSGGRSVLNFSDSFNRPDEPFFIGDNWLICYTQECTYSGANLAAAINVIAPNLVINQNNGLIAGIWAIPRLVTMNKIIGRNQFAQFRISAFNLALGVDLTIGPGVWANPQGSSAQGGYYIRLQNNAGALLARLAHGFNPITSLLVNTQPVVGDTIRIEARAGVGQNEVKYILNGVLDTTWNDNSATRPNANGMYGIAWQSGTVGGSGSFQNFSGGVL